MMQASNILILIASLNPLFFRSLLQLLNKERNQSPPEMVGLGRRKESSNEHFFYDFNDALNSASLAVLFL